jgi:hypothetical protein
LRMNHMVAILINPIRANTITKWPVASCIVLTYAGVGSHFLMRRTALVCCMPTPLGDALTSIDCSLLMHLDCRLTPLCSVPFSYPDYGVSSFSRRCKG